MITTTITLLVVTMNHWYTQCTADGNGLMASYDNEHSQNTLNAINYTTHSKVIKRSVGECGGYFTQESGTISSPNHPSWYAKNLNCYYYISGAFNHRIQLSFTRFSTEPNQDFVKIYDGVMAFDKLLAVYSGYNIPPPVTSTGSDMAIHFHSDESVSDLGFLATYSFENVFEPCVRTFTSSSGKFSSPSYPRHYNNDLNCEYLIRVSQGDKIRMSFTDFITEECCDHVEIHDGGSFVAPIIASYSGRMKSAETIISSGSELSIHFVSDSTIRDRGFMAVYTLYDNDLSRYSVCGCEFIFNTTSGIVYSHEDYPSNYPVGRTCSTTIMTTPVYNSVLLRFLDVSLYGKDCDSDKEYDQLTSSIFHLSKCAQGDYISTVNAIGKTLLNLRGHSRLNTTSTDGGSLTLNFISDNNVINTDGVRGFKAIFTLFYKLNNSGNSCPNDDFKCDTNRCIPGDLRCDGNSNCEDDTDEQDCGNRVSLILGCTMTICFIIAVLSTAVYCCRCKKSTSRHESNNSSTSRRSNTTHETRPKNTANPVVSYADGQVIFEPSGDVQHSSQSSSGYHTAHVHNYTSSQMIDPTPPANAPSIAPPYTSVPDPAPPSNAQPIAPPYTSVPTEGECVYNPSYRPSLQSQRFHSDPFYNNFYPPPSPPPSYESVINADSVHR